MQPGHLAELAELEESYWWHVAKRKLAMTLLERFAPPPGLLVEGGIGASGNLVAFRERGYDVRGFDIMPEAVSMGASRGIDSVSVHDLHQPWPVEDGSARAVVMLDVLEHTAEPVQVLANIKRILAPQGAMVLTVPACPWLFGDWDRMLGHYRRYTIRMLRKQATDAGLKLVWSGHWNSFTLPAAIAMRTLGKFRKSEAAEFPRVPRSVNSLLLSCASVERSLLFRTGVPAGLSVVGVLQHAAS